MRIQLMNSGLRKSTLVLLFFSSGALLIVLTVMDAMSQQNSAHETLNHRASLVSEFGLSDLAISTEARYTRHLSQADRHSAFQDHPTSFDHFPSGSIFMPPSQLTYD